jgi:thiamine biosynthesis lipoprotein
MPLTQYHQTKLALGSDVTLVLVTDALSQAVEDMFRQLWLLIYRFERQFSRFLPASELTQFNNKAGIRTPISDDFHELLATAQQLAETTDGLYNPFILPALQRAGYTRSFVDGYTDDQLPDYSKHSVVASSHLILEKGYATIPYGTALDMGGCGKGFLADKLAAQPLVRKLAGFWFSLGGDVTGGGHDEHNKPWVVTIQDAKHPTERLNQAIAGDPAGFAIATSGTIIRKGTTKNGHAWHHIIDPRTLQPAVTDITLATVSAPSAVVADVLASCAVIKGSAEAMPFLQSHQVTTALLQLTGGRAITSMGQFVRTHNGDRL